MIKIRDSVRIPGRIRVTWWLIVINLLAFVAMEGNWLYFYAGGVIPADFSEPQLVAQKIFEINQNFMGSGGLDRAPWFVTLIWAMFLHASWYHVLSNVAILAILGPNLEASLGRGRFLLLYLACGVVGYFAQILWNMDSVTPIIGASSPISGLMGAYFALFSDHYIRLTLGNFHSPNYRDVLIPIKMLLVYWLILQVFMGLLDTLLPVGANTTQVAYLTHIGGFACGYLLLQRGFPANFRRSRFKVHKGGRYNHDPYGGSD